jgi:putative membrane protein
MAPMMILFWGGIILLAFFVVRSFGSRSNNEAMDILRRRLANGDISQDEFEKTRKALQG